MIVSATPRRCHAPRPRLLVATVVLSAIALFATACGSATPSASGSGDGRSTTTQAHSSGHGTTTTSGSRPRSDSGGGTGISTAPTFPKNTTYSTIPAPQITTATVTVNGKVCPVPRETPGSPIDPSNDSGGQIVISSGGLLPFNLLVNIGQPIVWTNLTSSPVVVQFIDDPVTSPPIPPCGTFTYTFNSSYDFSYRTTTRHIGTVAVGAFQS